MGDARDDSGRMRLDIVSVRWGLGLALFGIVQRVILWRIYQPITYHDTYGGYMRLAGVIGRSGLRGYDGTRVPGYPAFLALFGLQEEKVWLAQMVLGWFISMLLFWMTWRTTGSAGLGFFVGSLYDLLPGQFFIEANLLTETLTAFWVVLSLAMLLSYLHTRTLAGGVLVSFILGVCTSAAGMIRALFFPLAVWFLPFVWLGGGNSWRSRFTKSAVYSLGPLIILGGWLLHIYTNSGIIAPTTRVGYNLVQHTGAFFEYLPDDFAPIRDTYLEYRDARIAERGVQINTIWEAIPAMMEASGLHFIELSRELQRLSFQLIREHPDLYLRSVIVGWLSFWKAPVVWQPSSIKPEFLQDPLKFLAVGGRLVSVGANLLFMLLSALAVVSRRVRSRLGIDLFAVAGIGIIWLISITQTLIEHGDNPRFLVPLQMVVIYLVVRSVWLWMSGWRVADDKSR